MILSIMSSLLFVLSMAESSQQDITQQQRQQQEPNPQLCSILQEDMIEPVTQQEECLIDKNESLSSSSSFVSMPTEDTTDSIVKYMNPQLFEDPQTISTIQQTIREGKAVVIENAFLPEFAEAVYADLLDNLDKFELHNLYVYGNSFSMRHHNIYEDSEFTSLMNATYDLFNSDDTKSFISDLSGRECRGDHINFGASYYQPGDYSFPHNDHLADRTVAFVWHLTKNWETSWGGHLYWCSDQRHGYLLPSFNTLTLFSVNRYSFHEVTMVSPHAKEKRIAVNGWYKDTWELSFDTNEQQEEGTTAMDDEDVDDDVDNDNDCRFFEDCYVTSEDYEQLTPNQYETLMDLADICDEGEQPSFVSEERCEKISNLADRVENYFEEMDETHAQQIEWIALDDPTSS